MKPTPANAPLDYAPPARKRARIVRRVLLAGLLGFAVFAAWRSVPSLVSRLQLASLYRQAESFRVAVPTTGSTDNPTHRLIRQLGHVVHPTVFSGMLQRGELRRLLHVGWAREPSGRHDIHFGAVFDHAANAVPRFT
ncbi:MAG TPA: hypothetical protein PKB10_07855, partial [Tepidisphaeraceae bacterium]|nr:hypothetical protein [Tepidisphaeraceae bacterium]